MFRIESIHRQVFIYNTNIGYAVINQHIYDMSTHMTCLTCHIINVS